tara:strand:- start:2185 stop:2325 length:141 start_codon:yes stop_codon:yes gene_type:complete
VARRVKKYKQRARVGYKIVRLACFAKKSTVLLRRASFAKKHLNTDF